MARAATKFAPQETVETFDFPQRSPEWYEARRGIPTASVFGTIMADGKDGGPSLTRARLMDQMAAEIISGIPADTYSNAAMERGIEQEPGIISRYAFENDCEVVPVGFVRRTIPNPLGEDLVVGCSPDGFVGRDGIVQVKSMQPDLLVRLVDSGRFPSEHKWQCHGEIFVTGRAWCALRIGYDDSQKRLEGDRRHGVFPLAPTWKIQRDERVIADLRAGLERFCYDLRQLVARVKQKGRLR